MDFSPSEELVAIRDLARKIFADRVTHERLLSFERKGEFFDDELWSELARAGLVALAIPEAHGGGGLGIEELCALLEEQGRQTAPVPLLATCVLGALPLTQFGTPAQRERWLRPVAEREAVLSAALLEFASSEPGAPRTTAKLSGDVWRLDGEKVCVPAADRASAILVPARTSFGVAVFVVDAKAEGITLEPQVTSHLEPQWRMRLSGAAAEGVLGSPGQGEAIVAWISDRTALALSAIQIGVAEEATARTARYIAERKQFGKAIATFQGVALRAADAWIDVEALRGVVMQAAWRVAAGLPATEAIASAKWWAATAGPRVVHTAQHLHGGIGSDLEYPIHRFFLWSKQNELLLGGARQTSARLGAYVVSDAHAVEA
jgi:alkylation response protein AidB-like acyl-CoA dehydrogenase